MTVLAATIRSRSVGGYDRLDANFYTSPGVEALERVSLLEASGTEVASLEDLASRIWDPSRFARIYATTKEAALPYLRPYDVFDFVPTAADHLSLDRNESVDDLRLTVGTILQTCSGRNLGPCAVVDEVLATYALSHDMIRIEIDDPAVRAYVLAFMQTPTGQALLRRHMSGSVIDHVTVSDVKGLPVPLVDSGTRSQVADRMLDAIRRTEAARTEFVALADEMASALPMPDPKDLGRHGWTVSSGRIGSRLDAAFHDPLVAAVREQISSAGGIEIREMATAIKPARYRRFYVEPDHGRPVLSGRQLLQMRPINLRYVSDRSFKDSSDYELKTGMTIFGGVGRADGRLGSPVMITDERSGWLASEDVVRLAPREGTSFGGLWLATSTPQAQLQISALTFGSVVDHLAAEDIDGVMLPLVPPALAARAEAAWWEMDTASLQSAQAIADLEAALN